MKKFLITIVCILGLFVGFDRLFFYNGILYIPAQETPTYFSMAQGESLYLDRGEGFEEFSLRGVNIGLGKPGHYATEYSITKQEYLDWFAQIQELGANVIRIYTLPHDDFYEAFYEYNADNTDPLYLIHGIWMDDYLHNASYSALDEEFYEPFLANCKAVVDTIHGRHKQKSLTSGLIPERYLRDISPWVYGYILGVEWESNLVSYTNHDTRQLDQFSGTYFYTQQASNFEILLAQIAEAMVAYETEKYGHQRLIAFSNWPTTDPLDYPDSMQPHIRKSASLDVEHIKCTQAFPPGQFASYHIYPYYPDYFSYAPSPEENTYLQYLRKINEHHEIPVVISEFGIPSSRGMASMESGLGRNQGFMSETQQGEALVSMYEDIMAAGSAGGLVFSWQDEWFKRTWNTMHANDLDASPYWSDYQTNEQFFGLLSFDPGYPHSICYVDGERGEWTEDQLVSEKNGIRLSMAYDQRFIYFLVEQEGLDLSGEPLYIPIDTTPNSGSFTCASPALCADAPMDFLLVIHATENSRVLVQERYHTLNALFYGTFTHLSSYPVPNEDSDRFLPIQLMIQKSSFYEKRVPGQAPNIAVDIPLTAQEYDISSPLHYSVLDIYETGKLRYGNANPNSPDFDSLADFCAGDGFVEIKIPWSLLNFADPSGMKIHADYYLHYGVEYLTIDHINVGCGDGTTTIEMTRFPLKKLGRYPEYHPRLKQSYYILKELWNPSGT